MTDARRPRQPGPRDGTTPGSAAATSDIDQEAWTGFVAAWIAAGLPLPRALQAARQPAADAAPPQAGATRRDTAHSHRPEPGRRLATRPSGIAILP